MDPISLIGIVFAFVMLMVSALWEGMSPLKLINPSAFILIAGGTMGATITCFTFEEIKTLISGIKPAFRKRSVELTKIFDIFGELAVLARREGLLVLENHPISIDNTLLKRGIHLVVDGTEPALLKDMLITELATYEQQAKNTSNIFQAAGGFAPTMGIIGTVMGLVNVLSNLEDPSELGPAISVAFLATLYGIASANVIFLPLGKKLGFIAKTETEIGLVIVEGLVSIQSGDNPRVVQEKLKSYIDEKVWPTLRTKAGGKEEKSGAA